MYYEIQVIRVTVAFHGEGIVGNATSVFSQGGCNTSR